MTETDLLCSVGPDFVSHEVLGIEIPSEQMRSINYWFVGMFIIIVRLNRLKIQRQPGGRVSISGRGGESTAEGSFYASFRSKPRIN